MDRLSKRKFGIVCHEKVVRIPLEGDEVLRVHGERTQGVVKTLMNTKVGESKLSDISVVRDFIDVFPEDLSMTTAMTKEEHGVHLKLELELLRKEKLYAKKGRVKLRRVRAMSMTIQSSVKDKILATPSETSKTLQKVLETRLDSSTAYHPQADGQSERMIQTLEDIMRACVIDFGGSYQLSIWGAPFEALYGRKYRVSPWKGVVRFRKKSKLAPRYVGPFDILERMGLVAYRLRLSEELSSVHDTFHVSNLKKCLADANLHVPLNEIKVDKTLRFVEEPTEIMDREIKKLKRKKIALVKVRWNSKRGPEFTWEHED
ncbi:putative reverse transcriptase domain-containing protein [Tanacetum coccineum]